MSASDGAHTPLAPCPHTCGLARSPVLHARRGIADSRLGRSGDNTACTQDCVGDGERILYSGRTPMVGADAPHHAGRVVRAMGGDARTSSRYDVSLASPDPADSTDVTPIGMGHNPFTREHAAAAAPPATDIEMEMDPSSSAEGAQVRFRTSPWMATA